MAIKPSVATETIECPLCLGEGELTRAEVLDRLGVKDFARVAQLSAEAAFRLLELKHSQDEQGVWVRFETELTRRTSEIKQRRNDELQALGARIKELEAIAKVHDQQNSLNVQRVRTELENKLRSEQSENKDLHRKLEDNLREVAQLRDRTRDLEAELSKVARIGKREEVDFTEDARTWPGVHVSDKLLKNDFILAFRALAVSRWNRKSSWTTKPRHRLVRTTSENWYVMQRNAQFGSPVWLLTRNPNFGRLTRRHKP